MNYKAFTLIFFVLIFCVSSTTSSRRLLSGGGGSKMETQPHHPKPAGSATDQQPPPGRKPLTYRALQRPPICNEKVYGTCVAYPSVARQHCKYGDRCKRSSTP
ncbi:uncharacterized protein LOC129874403 [Solanum dulcamara]|uniref:uncharacterized protein LOC129874403 n=1 Tax=Solanum dulcamara TaxID=45834 RepID=UPI0024850628|nr:uncharacterized protein LOC129874403 [Solanum dulcamara]